MNEAKPYSWPTREEWAVNRRTPYYDRFEDLRVDERLSSYLTLGEIQAMVAGLRELWKKLGREMRALVIPKELRRRPDESGRDYFQRHETFSPEHLELLEAESHCRFWRGEINEVLKDLRNDLVPTLWTNRRGGMFEKIRAPLDPVLVPYEAAREKAIEEREARIAATPIDDEAWEKELERRVDVDRYLANGPTIITH